MGPGPDFEAELARERRLYPFKKSLGPAEAVARREGANMLDGDWATLYGLCLTLSRHLGRRAPEEVEKVPMDAVPYPIDVDPVPVRSLWRGVH